jgi:hypothetical protein
MSTISWLLILGSKKKETTEKILALKGGEFIIKDSTTEKFLLQKIILKSNSWCVKWQMILLKTK